MSKLRLAITAGVVVAGSLGVSDVGTSLIAKFEGKSNTAYADPAHGWQVATICYGHTLTAYQGQRKTDGECVELLTKDIATHLAHLRTSLVGYNVTLTQGETDAYTSFIYNVGSGNWAKSSALRLLRKGDKWAACRAILPWVNAGGIPMAGLKTRRWAEYNVCVSDLQFTNTGKR